MPMEFMEWALKRAADHPDLSGAIVTADEQWLDVLLPDGRAFRFRPAALIREDAPEAERTAVLDRLLSIGVEQARAPETEDNIAAGCDEDSGFSRPDADMQGRVEARDPGEGCLPGISLGPAPLPKDPTTPIVPIVRAAHYFLNSHHGGDSMVYVPLTDFVGVGLAFDLADKIQPIYYSQLQEASNTVGELLEESVRALRGMIGTHHLSVNLAMAKIAGADVLTFLGPDNYELSWFCDVEMMMRVAESVREKHPESIPLFVPAGRTKLYVVYSEDDHLVDFFKLLLAQRHTAESVYPLPHTVAADGWKEWVPFPGSPLAEVLGALRCSFRSTIYADQLQAMASWGEDSVAKTFESKRLKSGERVSATEWNALDVRGSIPDTDFISFVRSPSPHPWEDSQPVRITIRSHIAREIWPEGIVKNPTLWPPRWDVHGFPSQETLSRLSQSADREF